MNPPGMMQHDKGDAPFVHHQVAQHLHNDGAIEDRVDDEPEEKRANPIHNVHPVSLSDLPAGANRGGGTHTLGTENEAVVLI